MKKNFPLFTLLLSLLFLQGCAAGLIVAAGTAVVVTSDERSLPTQLSDDKLTLAGIDKINELDIKNKSIRVNLIASNGYLLVIGQVENENQKQLIANQLNTINGVKEVYNELRIGKPISLSQHSKDTWITTKAKSLLTANESVNAFQIKVVTENSELFLIGRVDEKTANEATDIARKIEGVKRVNRVLHITPEKR